MITGEMFNALLDADTPSDYVVPYPHASDASPDNLNVIIDLIRTNPQEILDVNMKKLHRLSREGSTQRQDVLCEGA